MAKKEIKLSIQAILDDLNDGIVWYASEEENSETSIQTKYAITKEDIDDIRLHPALEGQEPSTVVVITLIDDRRVKNAALEGKSAKGTDSLVSLIDDRTNKAGQEKQPGYVEPVQGFNAPVKASGNKQEADFDMNFDRPVRNFSGPANFLDEL